MSKANRDNNNSSLIVARRGILPLIKDNLFSKTPAVENKDDKNLHQPLASVFHANTDFFDRSRSYFISTPVVDRLPYSEYEAQKKYLESKPICYVVFGKPGLETERLAESIAKEKKCVLISVTRLKREEKIGSEEFSWDSIVERVDEKDVNHRGYVIEGLPILKNDNNSNDENTEKSTDQSDDDANDDEKSNEDYVILTLTEISDEARSSCSLSSSGNDFEENSKKCECTKCYVDLQLRAVFNDWQLKPDVVVNVTCPDEEILKLYEIKRESDARSTIEYTIDNDDSDSTMDHLIESKLYQSTSTVTDDFGESLKARLKNYKKFAEKYVNSIVTGCNPQNVIEIDGRYPIEHAIQVTLARLQILPLQITIVPEKIYKEKEEEEYYEDSLEDDVTDLDRVFNRLKRLDAPDNAQFTWKLSRWGYVCPVALAEGQRLVGNEKFAVRFMNYVYFLSSQEAMEAFVVNPRTYLLPPNPRPHCRIAVIGPRYSGKTTLSLILAKKLDGVVIDVVEKSKINWEKMMSIDDHDVENSMTIDRCVNALVEAVEFVPDKKRGWILDGLYFNYELCKKLLENDVIIDTVIVFHESVPHDTLINRWIESQEKLSNEEICTADFEEISVNFEKNYNCYSMAEYVKTLRFVEDNKRTLAKKLSDLEVEVIMWDSKTITDDVSKYVIPQIYDEFQLPIETLKNHSSSKEEEEDDEEKEEYESSTTMSTDFSNDHEINFDVGDCKTYCPVALIKHNVLWKGKDEYRCLLGDKVYYMSCKSALKDFIVDNKQLRLPWIKALKKIPPVRIFITGPPSSGKSILADFISKEYGLIHVDFFKHFDEYTSDRGANVNELKLRLVAESCIEEEEDYSKDSSVEDVDELDDLIEKSVEASRFYLKYNREGAELPLTMANDCLLKYFKLPYENTGLIIDSFPNCFQDLEFALKSYVIPDVIIELDCDLDTVKNRSLDRLIRDWKLYRDEERRKKEKEEEIRLSSKVTSYCNTDEMEESEEIWDYSDDKINYRVQPRTEHDEDEWQDEEKSMKKKFSIHVEKVYVKTMKNLQLLRDRLNDETIPIVKVNTSQDVDQIFSLLRSILNPIVNRNSSLFETTREIDPITAERLLETGYYFISPLGKFCPVQRYQRKNPFPIYKPIPARNEMFAVLHRQYVYFVADQDSLDSFKKEPLKYIDENLQIPLLPIFISVIGPPKSGKSSLAERFFYTYGLDRVTRDQAIDFVLTNFFHTDLAVLVKKYARNGEILPSLIFAKVIKLFLSSSVRCLTQGCVFDGFPSSIDEYKSLIEIGIRPNVILDLVVSLKFTIECCTQTSTFSSLNHCSEYENWKTNEQVYRRWLSSRYENLVKIDGTRSRAWVWRRAEETTRERFYRLLNYLEEFCHPCDQVHDLEYLNVDPIEIREHVVDRFGLYCPSCVYFNNNFVELDVAKDRRTGLLQYRDRIYWFCPSHSNGFKKNFQTYVNMFDKIRLPNSYPKIIEDDVDLSNEYWSNRLLYNGQCLVTYVDRLPKRSLIPGKINLAVMYDHKLYLFCEQTCREKFCQKFLNYSKFHINMPQRLDAIPEIKDMPVLGYLEQSVAALIIKAAHRAGELRLKLPGLSSEASAAVFMGCYLKAHSTKAADSALYEKAMRRIEARFEFFKSVIEQMKKVKCPCVLFGDFAGEDLQELSLMDCHDCLVFERKKLSSIVEILRNTNDS